MEAHIPAILGFSHPELCLFRSWLLSVHLVLSGNMQEVIWGPISESVGRSGSERRIWDSECVCMCVCACVSVTGEKQEQSRSLAMVLVRPFSHLGPWLPLVHSPPQLRRNRRRRAEGLLVTLLLAPFSTVVVLLTELLDPATSFQHHHLGDRDYHSEEIGILEARGWQAVDRLLSN